MAQLTDEQRDVILMRFMEELSIQDVAEALNKTPGAVKGLQHRALRALSDAMQHISGDGLAEERT
jgi:RNA polymerase sigma-70 factor (ECF subfamily)